MPQCSSGIIVAIVAGALIAPQPALARCHSIWRYPWKQNCQVVTSMPRKTWFVDLTPTPPAPPPAPAPIVEAPVSPAVIETLNEELRWRAANSLTLEDKHNGD